MTSHGWGRGTIHTGRPTAEDVAEIARQISLVRGIIEAHTCKPDEQRYDILFEFDHLNTGKYEGYTLKNLEEKLRGIPPVGGHSIGDPIDFWVVQSSYQDGKRVNQHKKP